MTAFDLSLLPASASVDGAGRVAIAGVDLGSIAEQFGTPIYVYDEDDIRARCRAYRAVFGDGVAYASKAFLCVAMARLVDEEGLHLDVATGGELLRRARCGFSGRPDRLPRQQQVDGGAAARARSGRRTDRGRFRRRARPARDAGERRAPGAACPHPRDARRRGAHPRVHRDRHRGLQVRVRPRQRRGAWRPCSAWSARACCTSRVCTATSGRRCSGSTRSSARWRRWSGSCTRSRPRSASRSTSSTSVAASACAICPTTRRRRSSSTRASCTSRSAGRSPTRACVHGRS